MMSRLTVEDSQRRAQSNYRATVRYRCAPATVGKVFLSSDQEFQRAWVINISKTGVGLSLARPLPEGTRFILRLRGAGDGAIHELHAQVVQATLTHQAEWIVGCELLDPLSDEELDALL